MSVSVLLRTIRRAPVYFSFLLTGVALELTSCKPAESQPPSSPVSARIEPSPADAGTREQQAGAIGPGILSPNEIATAWFDALRRRDVGALLKRTQYPFELRDTGTAGTPGHCPLHRRADDSSGTPTVLACLFNDDVAFRVLEAKPDVEVESLQPAHLSAWPTSWREELSSTATPFGAFLRTNDAWYDFVIWVATSGVRAVWKTGVDATAEVAFATEWLEALRTRDLDKLERVTSYPFELRDTQVEAHCGSRSAAKPTEMRSAISCLLNDPIFGDALKMGFRIRAAQEQGFEPGVFQGWRRPEHGQLWPTMALVANGAGNEYDLMFLVAKNGVRVLWKRGSFISGD